ncbi:MAG: hypothetical protein E7393_00800 [Ruminococcaceae bacterium]|nr:hypothetical protein [Oscillospiraceae bacterium]
MYQILGACFVVFACSVFSRKIVTKQKMGWKAVEELSHLLTEFNHGISFQLETLPNLITRLSSEKSPWAQGFIQELYAGLQSEDYPLLQDVWSRATHTYAKNVFLPKEAEQILYDVGKYVGQMDVEIETSRLSLGAAKLNHLLDTWKKNSAKTCKTINSLGILLGIFIVIILI